MNDNNLKLETGWLCLDFANTADWHASNQPTESLNSYSDLAAWAERIGLLSGQEGQQLRQVAAEHSDEAEVVMKRAISLREVIYRVFSATSGERSPNPADLAALNRALPEALIHLQVTQTGEGFGWVWDGDPDPLDKMLWPIVLSTATLLTSEDLDRVKECEDDRGCGFLFFDTSRNRSRRWCTMRGCGNRAKVRRYRKRHGAE